MGLHIGWGTDATVEAALISGAATLIGVGGTVIVAVTSARNSRRTNQATIDAAHTPPPEGWTVDDEGYLFVGPGRPAG